MENATKFISLLIVIGLASFGNVQAFQQEWSAEQKRERKEVQYSLMREPYKVIFESDENETKEKS